jgi:SiaC family regulatory phosphoprotein
MNRLEIVPSNNTPHVVLDADVNTILIEGKSFPEDSKEFYQPIFDWLIAYQKQNPTSLKVVFNLFYLSSSSIISVKQFLMKIVEFNTAGVATQVIWRYDEDDDDIKKTGEDYEKLTNLSFQYEINE